MGEQYFMRSARSGAIMSVIAMLIVVETGALHFLLRIRFPIAAWVLTISSLGALVWLVADYRALGSNPIHIDQDRLVARIGRRAMLTAPTADVAGASQPGWRDLAGLGPAYLNATKPATPNVLVVFREPVEARVLGMRRRIGKLGLHMDQPDRFIAALLSRRQAIPRAEA